MNPKKAIGNQCSEAHYDACRAIAEEGIVLLKNSLTPAPSPKGEGSGQTILPLNLTKYRNILVVGENATRSLTQGGGSSELKTLRDISPLEALQDLINQQNTLLPSPIGEGSGVRLSFAQGYTSGRALYDQVDTVDPAENERLKAEALEKATKADLIIYIGGLNKNTKQDCENGDRESYDLSFGQNELISQLAQIQPNIVVVTFGGNAYATPWLQQVKALVHCWYLGSESGTALANVLTGKVCPSGKLPVTFAKRYEDYPYVRYGEEAYQSNRSEVTYKEGIYVGYRGFDRDKTQPLFPFGYGLSYTTFQYGQPTVQVSSEQASVEVTVRNTGSVAGKEVAQVYVSAPKNKQMDKPVKELKGFAKTRLLQPGESETLRISIPRSELASWNETTHQWQVDSGTYTLQVGASSADIRGKAKISL
jgi:beta-glucosidase